MTRKRKALMVDTHGFVFVDGVKVGKAVRGDDGEPCIQFFDKDRRRCAERGSNQVAIAVKALFKVVNDGCNGGFHYD